MATSIWESAQMADSIGIRCLNAMTCSKFGWPTFKLSSHSRKIMA
jgi:hypothetical protein